MGIVAAITGVFDSMFTWLISAIQSVLGLFWDATANTGTGALTVLGVLAVIALSISIFFLLVHLIMQFLHFRAN